MPLHDYQCKAGHVVEHLVTIHDYKDERTCEDCGQPAKLVFLTPPKIDWAGMAMGASAGPEFIDRFEKVHKDQAEKERKCWNEHGDYGSDAVRTMDRQPDEPDW